MYNNHFYLVYYAKETVSNTRTISNYNYIINNINYVENKA